MMIRIHPNDNVAVLLQDLGPSGLTEVGDQRIVIKEAIAAGHKVALHDIAVGEPVVKFNTGIGVASRPIGKGQWVHSHNISPIDDKTRASQKVFSEFPSDSPELQVLNPMRSEALKLTGFSRKNGSFGFRNYIAVIPTVNCAAGVANRVARAFEFEQKKNFDGVFSMPHHSGCGLSKNSDDLKRLRRTLSGISRNPNLIATVWISLGCEDNDLRYYMDRDFDDGANAFFSIQESGGSAATIEKAVNWIRDFLQKDISSRVECSMSNLRVALNCGGSDSYSALTANPVLGIVSDLIVSNGGTVFLGETPELHGSIEVLKRRARTINEANNLDRLISSWRNQLGDDGSGLTFEGQPAPGNLEGGISTVIEKSLGSLQKGGSSLVNEVIDFAEIPKKSGLIFMDTPGYDPISVTGMMAGGANLVAFTTGRGSVLGGKPAPVVKIGSNQRVVEKMAEDIDFDASRALEHPELKAEIAKELLNLIIDTANGQATKSEMMNFGDEELIPWIRQATL